MSILRQKHNASSYHKLEGTLDSHKIFILLSRTASLKKFIICVFLSTSFLKAEAQLNEADFRKTLHDRSVKIVNTLNLTDSVKYNDVVNLVTDQYFNLNKVHDKTKESIAAIKSTPLPNEDNDSCIQKEEAQKTAQLKKIHEKFIAQLQKSLTENQIEKIKDGMTYKVMPVTYTAYHDMIPTLTAEQKEKIYGWLKEARELAMDEGSSEDKHKVFGKYKGRINNYLSKQGYDMKVEEKGWQQRIKDREAAKKNNVS